MVKVTFSILCYNYGRYLPHAITSCLNQFSENVECEILVIDDGSTDNTKEVCKDFSNRIKIVSEGNKGFASTLTRSIQCASGEFVFLLDADDYFLEGKLMAFLPHLLNGKLFVCDRVYPLYEPENSPKTNLHIGGSTSTIAVNRKAALDILPVENELSFHVLEKMGHGIKLKDAYTVYRYHDKSMTNRKESGKWNTYLAGVTHRLADRIEDMIERLNYPEWFLPKSKSKRIAAMYRSQAYYNELEASLEQKKIYSAFCACAAMLKYAFRSNNGLKMIHFKMIIKTIFLKPSFKKK